MTVGDNGTLIHQLQSHMTQLKILCVTWQPNIHAIPSLKDRGILLGWVTCPWVN